MSARITHASSGHDRRGALVVVAAIIMVFMVGFIALGVDVGYFTLARTQLQVAADAAALAGAGGMYQGTMPLQTLTTSIATPDPNAARLLAQEYAGYHRAAAQDNLHVDLNYQNDPEGDIVLGRFYTPYDLDEPLDYLSGSPNTVFVNMRLDSQHTNGSVGLFFARIFGISAVDVSASAAATVRYPAVLPLTTSEKKWADLQDGGDGDGYTYSPGLSDFGVETGPDGVPELHILPGPWDGNASAMPPGNFGWVNIGSFSGDTILRQQIDMGPSYDDFMFHGGSVDAGMELSGQTGFNVGAAIAIVGGHADGREYPGIIGEVRYLPLYDHAQGPGTNATFRVSRFVAARIMAVEIDARARYHRGDNVGAEVRDSIVIQPVTDENAMVKPHLTR